MSSDGVDLAREAGTLPDGWRIAPFSTLAEYINGRAFKPEDWGTAGLPIIRIAQITNPDAETNFYDGEVDPRNLIGNGDLIFSWSATLAVMRWDKGPAVLNQHLFKVTPNEGIDRDWLQFRLEASIPDLADEAHGTTMKHIRKGTLSSQTTVIPPLDEQQRIAEVLRSVDETIAATDALLTGIKASKQGTMEAVLSGGFPEVRLEALLAKAPHPMRSGPFGSALLKSELQPEGIPFLGIDNVHVERFAPVYRRFVSQEKYQELARYTVFPGDVMVTIMGTVGRCCVVPSQIGTAISSKHVWTLTIDRDLYSPALLAWQINHSPRVLEQLQGSAQGGIMSAISSGILRELLVPLPPPAEVREAEAVLLSFNSQIEAIEAEKDQTQALKAALLSDLLSGRVRISAPAVSAVKSVPSAFKRAVFAAEIVHQLHNDNRFGSVKHEKIVHLCELHLGLQDDLDRHAYKEAAGPYDPKARRSVERIFQQQKWFAATKPDGNRVVYLPLEKEGGHAEYFDRYFGDQKPAIQSIIDLLRPLNTEQCEIVATLYAVWNDFLIDEKQPTEEEIVASVLQWHPKKQQIAKDRWVAALPWMRQKGLIPKGIGQKTRVAQA